MQAQQQPAPTIELNENTENALAGKIVAHQSPEHLDPSICLICQEHTFGDSVMATASCQHHLHPECLQDALKANRQAETRCPCGAVFPPGCGPMVDTNRVHREMMNLVKVECPQGCGRVMKFEWIHGHVHKDDGCPNTPYRCGCGTLFLRKDKNAHLNSCPHRLVSCELCEQRVKHNELRQHKARQCTRRKVCCSHCKREYIYNEKVHHMQVCPVRREHPDAAKQNDITELLVKHKQCSQQFGKKHQQAFQQQLLAFQQQVAQIQAAEQRALLPQKLVVLYVRPCGGVPVRIRNYRGEYTLRPLQENINGAAVWGKDDYRLYRSSEGRWALTKEADGPQRNRGDYRLDSELGSLCPERESEGGWQSNEKGDDINDDTIHWHAENYLVIRKP